MIKITQNVGCIMVVNNRFCSVSEMCEVCGLCPKHCIEHYGNRYGFRMIRTNSIQSSRLGEMANAPEDFKIAANG